MPEEINHRRRRFLGTAAMTIAAAELGMIGSARALSSKLGANTSFASLKQIDAGLLNVGYAEAGPADGPAVILLHGWPYDIHSYVDVAPLLASAGYRVIVPYLRGYGTTRFLSSETFRNGLCLGRADSQHHRRALAGALQGHGLRERLSDRQPGSRQDAVATTG